ncbi:hypothetical protein J6590_028681 [Homalodisca vitripennis]|nr:hypothetical protein J6590_028681 [Homalodisca vitripennis]
MAMAVPKSYRGTSPTGEKFCRCSRNVGRSNETEQKEFPVLYDLNGVEDLRSSNVAQYSSVEMLEELRFVSLVELTRDWNKSVSKSLPEPRWSPRSQVCRRGSACRRRGARGSQAGSPCLYEGYVTVPPPPNLPLLCGSQARSELPNQPVIPTESIRFGVLISSMTRKSNFILYVFH